MFYLYITLCNLFSGKLSLIVVIILEACVKLVIFVAFNVVFGLPVLVVELFFTLGNIVGILYVFLGKILFKIFGTVFYRSLLERSLL